MSNKSGTLSDVYCVSRPVTPDAGCLHCNRLINAVTLQHEAISLAEQRVQKYVDDPVVIAPSVITLNALASAQASNDFLFYMTGLTEDIAPSHYVRCRPLQREVWHDKVRSDPDCLHCGTSIHSRFARGDGVQLPVKLRHSHA